MSHQHLQGEKIPSAAGRRCRLGRQRPAVFRPQSRHSKLSFSQERGQPPLHLIRAQTQRSRRRIGRCRQIRTRVQLRPNLALSSGHGAGVRKFVPERAAARLRGAEERRLRGRARSALLDPTRRSSSSAVSAANEASSTAGHETEHRRGVGAQRRPHHVCQPAARLVAGRFRGPRHLRRCGGQPARRALRVLGSGAFCRDRGACRVAAVAPPSRGLKAFALLYGQLAAQRRPVLLVLSSTLQHHGAALEDIEALR